MEGVGGSGEDEREKGDENEEREVSLFTSFSSAFRCSRDGRRCCSNSRTTPSEKERAVRAFRPFFPLRLALSCVFPLSRLVCSRQKISLTCARCLFEVRTRTISGGGGGVGFEGDENEEEKKRGVSTT